MKALIVVLLITAQLRVTRALVESCWTEDDLKKPFQENMTGQGVDYCAIAYRWDENADCVFAEFFEGVADGGSASNGNAICGTIADIVYCECYENNCNANDLPTLRTFQVALIESLKWEPDQSLINLTNCLIKKSNEQRLATTPLPTTTTTASIASTNTTVVTSLSSLDRNGDKSSSFLGLFIGSAVFNGLTVVTILVLVIVIIKMKKGGGAKQGSAKTEQKVPPTATVVQIENPIEVKKSSEVLPSIDNKADQGEAAADSTTLNTATDGLDTTGSSSISDSSTGQYGAGQVQITVRGFQKE